jgi:hypothetical protein
MDVESGAPFEAFNEVGIAGLVGTIAVKILDNVGGTPVGPTTANITEVSPGIYVWIVAAAPTALGQYTIVWSTDGSFDEDTVSTDPLVIVSVGSVSPSPIPVPDDAASTEGPCTGWLTGDEVADCCSASEEVGTATVLLDDAADVASQLLYELSGRRWVGLCSRTVRPCHSNCGCGWQVLSRGHIVGSSWACEGRTCGCRSLSRVRLAGYVREITQVKIDGIVVDASVYRVDEHQWLTRIDGSRWPACAHVDLPDTEEGTFSVSYTYGKTPPLAGVEAAKQLACQIFTRCSNSGASVDCQIPEGAVRVTRQGITVERAIFARNPQTGAWESGLSAVDQFLNSYNPKGIPRRGLFISPRSSDRFARPVG